MRGRAEGVAGFPVWLIQGGGPGLLGHRRSHDEGPWGRETSAQGGVAGNAPAFLERWTEGTGRRAPESEVRARRPQKRAVEWGNGDRQVTVELLERGSEYNGGGGRSLSQQRKNLVPSQRDVCSWRDLPRVPSPSRLLLSGLEGLR